MIIADGFTYIVLLVLLSGEVKTVEPPAPMTLQQCRFFAMDAPQELRDLTKFAACVKKHPST